MYARGPGTGRESRIMVGSLGLVGTTRNRELSLPAKARRLQLGDITPKIRTRRGFVIGMKPKTAACSDYPTLLRRDSESVYLTFPQRRSMTSKIIG